MHAPCATRRGPFSIPRASACLAVAALVLLQAQRVSAQAKTLVAVLAHADDETPAGPVLARYAREGAHVYLIIASNGGQGTLASGGAMQPDSAQIAAMARARADEARCATAALGANAPILLGFPDGKLGDYTADRSLLYRLTASIAAELERLRPDAVITWGPDGGTGHPDHRLVSGIVSQLVHAGAPGVLERLFYMYIPPQGFSDINPQRGAPPLLVPQPKYLTVHVPFQPTDLDAAQKAMACHKSQFTPETLQRYFPAQARLLNGQVTFTPAFSNLAGTDLFR